MPALFFWAMCLDYMVWDPPPKCFTELSSLAYLLRNNTMKRGGQLRGAFYKDLWKILLSSFSLRIGFPPSWFGVCYADSGVYSQGCSLYALAARKPWVRFSTHLLTNVKDLMTCLLSIYHTHLLYSERFHHLCLNFSLHSYLHPFFCNYLLMGKSGTYIKKALLNLKNQLFGVWTNMFKGFPDGLVGKESTCITGNIDNP